MIALQVLAINVKNRTNLINFDINVEVDINFPGKYDVLQNRIKQLIWRSSRICCNAT